MPKSQSHSKSDLKWQKRSSRREIQLKRYRKTVDSTAKRVQFKKQKPVPELVKVTSPKRKVPNILFCWHWFKENFLNKEENRSKLFDTNFTKHEFTCFIKKKISFPQQLPNYCRNTSKKIESTKRARNQLFTDCYSWYLEILHRDSSYYVAPSPGRGLGLFSRKKVKVPQEIYFYPVSGMLYSLNSEMLSEVRDMFEYPSLYKNNIMYGPLSLINSDCASCFTLAGSKKCSIRNREKKFGNLRKGEEIFVKYNYGTKCKFSMCSKHGNKGRRKKTQR